MLGCGSSGGRLQELQPGCGDFVGGKRLGMAAVLRPLEHQGYNIITKSSTQA